MLHGMAARPADQQKPVMLVLPVNWSVPFSPTATWTFTLLRQATGKQPLSWGLEDNHTLLNRSQVAQEAGTVPVRELLFSCNSSNAAIPAHASGSNPLSMLPPSMHVLNSDRAPQEAGRVPFKLQSDRRKFLRALRRLQMGGRVPVWVDDAERQAEPYACTLDQQRMEHTSHMCLHDATT